MSGRSENQATCYEFLGFDSWPVSESSFIAGQLIEGIFPWVGLSCWGCQVGGEFKQWPPIRFFGGLSPPAPPLQLFGLPGVDYLQAGVFEIPSHLPDNDLYTFTCETASVWVHALQSVCIFTRQK